MSGRGKWCGSGLGEQQSHGIAFVAKGRLDTDKDVTKLLAVHKHVLAVGVQIPRRQAPIFVEFRFVVAQLLVLSHRHSVFGVQVRRLELRFLVVQDRIDQVHFVVRAVTDVVTSLLQVLQDSEDGTKDVQVPAGTGVPFVGGKRKHGDGQVLLRVLLASPRGPLDGSVRNLRRAIFQSVGFTRLGVSAGKDDRFQTTVQLRKRDLQRDLHEVQTKA